VPPTLSNQNHGRFSLDTQQTGAAGEFAVALDLTLKGYRVSMAAPGLPYDLTVDVGGRLYRLQVKATTVNARERDFVFRTKGSKHREYDLIGFVAFFDGQQHVGYLPAHKASDSHNRFAMPGTLYHKRRKGLNLDDNSFEDALHSHLNHTAP
jgi:hypothetical protein